MGRANNQQGRPYSPEPPAFTVRQTEPVGLQYKQSPDTRRSPYNTQVVQTEWYKHKYYNT